MPSIERVIYIHPAAPSKVAAGAPCNGCGVCCLLEPCPLGMLISRGRNGPCHAVRWEDSLAQYRCGAVMDSQDVLTHILPLGTRWLAPTLAPALRRLARRWIAAGIGCDSSAEVVSAHPEAPIPDEMGGASTTMGTADLTKQRRTMVLPTKP